MTPEEAVQLKARVKQLEDTLALFVGATDYKFRRPIRGSADGLRFFTSASEKLSYYGVTPIAQWSSGTGRQDVHDNTGSAMNLGARFTGNVGSTYYGVGDIVAALKGYGLLA